MTGEIAIARPVLVDFVEEFTSRLGYTPLSAIRRQTLTVHGCLPRISECETFLRDGVRIQEDDYRKVIYKIPDNRSVQDRSGFLDFAGRYIYTTAPAKKVGERNYPASCTIFSDCFEERGRPYVRATFHSERITRMELGYRLEKPDFVVMQPGDGIIRRTSRAFWRKGKAMRQGA